MPTAFCPPLRVLERAVYRGPHLYSLTPMVRVRLDLGSREDWPSNRIPGFVEGLEAELPGLHAHGCCYGRPGGFITRLRGGTWLGHVVEHVALELQSLTGVAVTRGKTRSVKGRTGVYDVLFAYEEPELALLAGRLALQIVDHLLPPWLQGLEGLDRVYDGAEDLSGVRTVAAALPVLERVARQVRLGPSTRALAREARRRGIPVERLDAHSLLQLGWGARQARLRASVIGTTSLVASEAASDKALTKALLEGVGIPVARGALAAGEEDAVRMARGLRKPLVLKPLRGNHGRGVSTDVRSDEQVRGAYALAAVHGRRVIVEEQLPGRDYRILVVGGQVVAVAERRPAQVLGDGVSTIAELVRVANCDPRRGDGHEKALTRISIDEGVLEVLRQEGLSPDSIPKAGQAVRLRSAANLSSGGEAIDRTDDIHPETAAMARRTALVLGLDVAGIDLMAPDIGRPIRETGGGVVEVNAGPGLRMHLAPSEGQARNVARPILEHLCPRGRRMRIPVLAVTGTNGKSTVCRMLAHIFRTEGRVVGLTGTSGAWVGDECVFGGDASGPRSARMILRDPTVEVAILECARGGILREGLAFDRCDVGAVLNISADHLGLKGIETLEDLAAVKSVVVESVARRGVSVLNGDDPRVIAMARYAGGRIAWFSMRGGHDAPGFIQKHVAEGGLAALYDPATEAMVLCEGGAVHALGPATAVPASFGGRAAFNIQNALAAALMAYGAGVTPNAICSSLQTFTSNYEQNPGRMNFREVNGVGVIMDYAHNPEALEALGATAGAMRRDGGRLIAMVSMPGDRRDDDIRQMGAIAARHFDHLVFRETPDNRGRPSGAVTALLAQGAREAGCGEERIHIINREPEAAAYSLAFARAGDLVILTPTRIEDVWRQVLDYRGPPVSAAAVLPLGDVRHG